MAIVDDVMEFKIITELDGVQMANTRHFQIDDLGDDPNPNDMLGDIIVSYHAAIEAQCSDQWKVVCGIMENITNPEGQNVRFVTLAGGSAIDAHPQHQVLRFNIYTKELGGDRIMHGAFNQSGIIESKSLRGRLNNPADFDAMVTFLRAPFAFGGTGWEVTTVLRWNDGTPQTPFFKYDDVRKVQVLTEFKTLRSRKTKFCAVQ